LAISMEFQLNSEVNAHDGKGIEVSIVKVEG
jgi:hypothetical protein